MTELDQALEKLMQDEQQQAQYYDLVLNTDFYIPISEADTDDSIEDKEAVTPLIFESEGKSYLMLFDREERLTDWAKQPVPFVVVAGFQIAKLSTPDLHWAVNIGGQFAKEFVPDEINWLKEGTAQA
jgi:hypothetical protein